MDASDLIAGPRLSPEEIASALEAELGAKVSIWSRTSADEAGGWQPVVSVDTHDSRRITAWLASEHARLSAGETASRCDASHAAWIAIPWPRPRKSLLAAVAALPADPQQIAARSARLAVQAVSRRRNIEELNATIQDYVSQVTNDLEEMTYLRRVTRFLEFLDVSHSVDDAAARILPQLQELVQVEGIFFVTPHVRPQAPPEPARVAVRCGGDGFQDEHCLNVIRRLSSSLAGPIVRNVARCRELQQLHPALRSVSIVTISRGEQFFGWLLAVNRIMGHGDLGRYAHDSSEAELGTIETSLMESTAVLLSSHAHNVQAFRAKEELIVEIVRSLVAMLDARDRYTCGHSDRVAAMARRLAELHGLSPGECETIYLSGLLHDIGKVGVPDEVLRKPGPLTDAEFALIQEHPQRGYDILRGIEPLQATLPGVLHHHEAVDGSGYPHGLQGDQIPLIAKILAVADTFDALTSQRPYRQPRSLSDAVAVLKAGRGRQWDGTLVDVFLNSIDDFVDICAGSSDRTNALLRQAGLSDVALAPLVVDSLRKAVRTGALRPHGGGGIGWAAAEVAIAEQEAL